MDMELITLTADDGTEEEYEFLDMIEYEGGNYAVLIETNNEDGEVSIFKVEHDEEDEENDNYLEVESDEVLEQVFELFKEKNKGEIEFED